MKKKQINKLNMYRTVHQTLDGNQSVWNGVPAFTIAKDEFYIDLVHLIQLAQQQKVIKTGVTLDKNAVIDASVLYSSKLSSALKSFATATNDIVLFDKVNLSKSKLTQGPQAVVLGRLTEILNLSVEHQTVLEDFGIVAEDIQVLTDSLTQFQDLMVAPRLAIVARKQITGEIKTLVKKIDEHLRYRIDPLVKVLKHANRKFANKFFSARMIIDTGARHRSSQNPDHDDGSSPNIRPTDVGNVA